MQKFFLKMLIEDLEPSAFKDQLVAFQNSDEIAALPNDAQILLHSFLRFLPADFQFDISPDAERLRYLFRTWLLKSEYANTQTFFNITNIEDIPLNQLIILDNCVFATEELREFLSSSTELINPHGAPAIESVTREFSEEARNILRNHSIFSAIFTAYEDRLARQQRQITPEIIAQVKVLLGELLEDYRRNQSREDEDLTQADEATARFCAFKDTLPDDVRTNLENYIIQVPILGGGFQSLRFIDALMGGNSMNRCILTAQVFLWHFVKENDPTAEIPQEVLRIAHLQRYNLGEAPAPAVGPADGRVVFDFGFAVIGMRPVFGQREEDMDLTRAVAMILLNSLLNSLNPEENDQNPHPRRFGT